MTVLSPVSEGVVYYLRVHPGTSTFTDTGTLAWTTSARVTPLLIAVSGDVLSTPGWLGVTVSNGTPLDSVDFSIDGGATVFSGTLDDTGQVLAISVPLASMSAGSHTVTATTPTLSASTTFNIIHAPTAYPSAPGADTAAAFVAQDGVVKWMLQIPGGDNYIFPINPNKMSAPHAARVFTTAHSTAPDGQPLTFEGAAVGVDWTIEGTCLTEEFHNALEGFLALPQRVYLIDQLSRAWTVTVETINWTRLRQVHNDWAFTYSLKAIIYAGPQDLS